MRYWPKFLAQTDISMAASNMRDDWRHIDVEENSYTSMRDETGGSKF